MTSEFPRGWSKVNVRTCRWFLPLPASFCPLPPPPSVLPLADFFPSFLPAPARDFLRLLSLPTLGCSFLPDGHLVGLLSTIQSDLSLPAPAWELFCLPRVPFPLLPDLAHPTIPAPGNAAKLLPSLLAYGKIGKLSNTLHTYFLLQSYIGV